MNQIIDFLKAQWFAVFLVVVALGFAVFAIIARVRGGRWLPWLIAAGASLLAGAGGLALEPTLGGYIAGAAGLAFFVMFLILVLTSRWWVPAAYAFAGVLAFGLGGLGCTLAGKGLAELGRTIISLEPSQPWWLLLLLLIPLIVVWSYRSLAGLGRVRRWLALGLRCALVLFLTLALAEMRIKHQNENVTVLFLVDRSLSVPEEPDPNNPDLDRRWERVKLFINDAVEKRGSGHERDQAGLIVFGKRPRLELPPSDAPRFKLTEVASTIDPNYTDIAAAIKLALASFPEGSGKRIVLISDGNENLGDAKEQSRLAKLNGVQIDVVPLAAGKRNENEVLIESVQAPPIAQQGVQLPIRVVLRNHNPNPVRGLLKVKKYQRKSERFVLTDEALDALKARQLPADTLEKIRPLKGKVFESREEMTRELGKILNDAQRDEVVNAAMNNDPQGELVDEREVTVEPAGRGVPGLTTVTIKQPVNDAQRSYTYEAEFLPRNVVTPEGLKPVVGDRPQNNKVTTHVIARGQRRILLIEQEAGDHATLVREMTARKMKVSAIPARLLPKNKDNLSVLFSDFDAVILANLPAELLTEEQQEAIRTNTHEQGCGLVMIGGPDSYGAGGWQNTPVEKALPVDSEIKALKVQGKGGLVLIMHASEMADGNYWQKKIAKLAIEKLSTVDEIGVLHYDWGVHKWHIPLMEIGEKRAWMMGQIDKLTPGDMPDFDGPLQMAHKALIEPERELTTRHVIIISDGDPALSNNQLLAQMKKDKVTISTVGVATHGAPQSQALAAIAQATGGRFYNVTNPNMLPAVYIKETRLVSQSFLYEKKFTPRLVFKGGPTEKMGDPPPLYGFVRTSPKSGPLVEVPIESPKLTGDMTFPILAYWHYGLGKSVAFTSDARSQEGRRTWDRDWADSDMYVKFWEQVIDWVLRPTESKNLVVDPRYVTSEGKIKIVVDARDEKGQAELGLLLRGKVSTPSGKDEGLGKTDLKFTQTNSGVYEAEIKAEEAGSYFVNVQAYRMVNKKDKEGKVVLGPDGKPEKVEEAYDSARSGVTVPYSPEYADLETNTKLLEDLRAMTDGKSYADDAKDLAAAVSSNDLFRRPPATYKNVQPVWYWLVFLAAVGLLFDVGVRRIAVEMGGVVTAVTAAWDRLRGRMAASEAVPEFFDRLRTRKAAIGQALETGGAKAAKRFDADDAPTTTAAPPPGADAAPTAPPIQRPARPKVQEPAAEGGDFLGRLKKAKKRAMQDHEKDEE
jgi:uncharacterized membrane protein